jgi:hypothetical protein
MDMSRDLQIEPQTSNIKNLFAGVVQWQNGSFPSCTRGFDSPHPLFLPMKNGRPARVFGQESEHKVRTNPPMSGIVPLPEGRVLGV